MSVEIIRNISKELNKEESVNEKEIRLLRFQYMKKSNVLK